MDIHSGRLQEEGGRKTGFSWLEPGPYMNTHGGRLREKGRRKTEFPWLESGHKVRKFTHFFTMLTLRVS